MAQPTPQTYKNHARWVPMYHFVMGPILGDLFDFTVPGLGLGVWNLGYGLGENLVGLALGEAEERAGLKAVKDGLTLGTLGIGGQQGTVEQPSKAGRGGQCPTG